MTVTEHQLLILAQVFTLVSIPLALLAFQVWFRRPPASPAPQPVIPHEDESPAGSFLDVNLPPPALPLPEEKGVPVRQWKRVDGWMALLLTAMVAVLMGPQWSTPGKPETAAPVSPDQWIVQLAFQIGVAGLVLFYVNQIRHLDLMKVFGLRRLNPLSYLGQTLLLLIPGVIGILVITSLVNGPLLRLLGLDAAPPQAVVIMVQSGVSDPLTKTLIIVTACIGAPLMEEVVFRGFLYSVAKRFTHISYAAVASSLMFAVIHGNMASFLPLMLLGLLFVAAYEATGSLLVCILMHGLFNLWQLAGMFLQSELLKHAQ